MQIEANKCNAVYVDNTELQDVISKCLEINDKNCLTSVIVGYLMAQLSTKKGMKKYGEKAVEAL